MMIVGLGVSRIYSPPLMDFSGNRKTGATVKVEVVGPDGKWWDGSNWVSSYAQATAGELGSGVYYIDVNFSQTGLYGVFWVDPDVSGAGYYERFLCVEALNIIG